MCGIAGLYFKNEASNYLEADELENLVDWLLIGIEPRGDHAAGIAAIDKWGITSLEKADVAASKFILWRREVMPQARTILLHTRWATQGSPMNLLNNHPIEYGNAMVVHNGHINNDSELFREEDIPRLAEVDSEIIAALFNKYGIEDAKTALEKLYGNYAIAAFDKRNPSKLVLAKGPSSPLVYLENSEMIVWASTEKCLQESLEKGIGYEVKQSELKNLKYGEYMVIDGENVSIKDFSPSFRPITQTVYHGVQSGKNETKSWFKRWSDGHYSDTDYCTDCWKEFKEIQLKRFGNHLLCYDCEKQLFEYDDNGFTKKKNVTSWDEVEKDDFLVIDGEYDDIEGDDHWAICELVAEECKTKADVVDFILFGKDDVISVDDPNFINLYVDLQEKYDFYYKELVEGFSFVKEKGKVVGFQ